MRADYAVGHTSWGILGELLTHHVERKRKDGPCMLGVEVMGGRRDENVQRAFVLIFDLDGKFSVQQVRKRLKTAGLEAFFFSTHNHCKTDSHVAASTYWRWAESEGLGKHHRPSNATLARFCASKPKFDHLTGLRILHDGETRPVRELWGETDSFLFSHDPEPKLRVAILLSEPIPLVGLNGLGIDGYGVVYNAVGGDLLDGRHDTSCANPSRIFYLPSHRPGAPYCTGHNPGAPLDWRQYWKPEIKAEVEQHARARDTARLDHAPAGVEELVSVLNSIPADVPYHEWFRCLAAIYHETEGAEDGRELAHSWSSEDPRYDPDQVDAIWDWLTPVHRNPATMGSLVHMARQYDPQFRLFGSIPLNYQLLG